MARTEDQKAELTFKIDAFQRPMELSKYDAWAQQIISLMLTTPGTFPSIPEYGCALDASMFNTLDYMNTVFADKVTTQVSQYLEELPFDSISFTEYESGSGIVLISINFVSNAAEIETVVVAMSVDEKSKTINFSDYFNV